MSKLSRIKKKYIPEGFGSYETTTLGELLDAVKDIDRDTPIYFEGEYSGIADLIELYSDEGGLVFNVGLE